MPFILTQGIHLDPVGGQFARNISLLVGAEDACARGLEPIERVLRRMAVAVARPCADQRDARRKDGGLLVVEGVLGSVMAHLVEVDGVHKPFVDERAQLRCV